MDSCDSQSRSKYSDGRDLNTISGVYSYALF